MSTNNTSSSGVGVGGLLLVAFIILKLCEVIDWSWWWVLSPMWIPLAVIVAIGIILGISYLLWRAACHLMKQR